MEMNKKNLRSKTKELWKNPEYRKRMSEAHKGQRAWNKGIPLSKQISKEINEQRKIKIGKTLKRKYKSGDIKPYWLGKGIGHTTSKGYRLISINGKYYFEHHLMWLKANQLHRIPKGCVIHHCDGDKLNNSIDNLQLLDNSTHTKLHKLIEWNKD